MDLDAILTAIIAKVSGLSGVVGANPYHPDEIPDTPYFTTSMPRGRLVSGSWELTEFQVTLRCYYARNDRKAWTTHECRGRVRLRRSNFV